MLSDVKAKHKYLDSRNLYEYNVYIYYCNHVGVFLFTGLPFFPAGVSYYNKQ